jgi:hypothetical protein
MLADAVPPVEEERAGEPADESFHHRHLQAGKLEDRRAREGGDPELVGRKRNGDLAEVDEDGATIPAGCIRKLAAGPQAFERQERRRRSG